MDAWKFLKDVEARVGYVEFSSEHDDLVRLARFWSGFHPDDRPFLHSKSLTIKNAAGTEAAVSVPAITMKPSYILHMAVRHGAKGRMKFDEMFN